MSEEIYQEAKSVFSNLIDQSPAVRRQELERLQTESPKLAQEVRSLLEYHTEQSFVLPSSEPRIKTRSTLATTYQSSSWSKFRGSFFLVAFSLPVLIVGLCIAWWIDQQVQSSTELSVYAYLDETVENRKDDFLRWEEEKIEEANLWTQSPQVAGPIQALVARAQQATSDTQSLRSELCTSEEAKSLGIQLQQMSGNQTTEFAIWDRRMLPICTCNPGPEYTGGNVTPVGASLLNLVLSGNAKLSIPSTTSQVTQSDSNDGTNAAVAVFAPVRSQDGIVIAVLMVRGYGLDNDYNEMLEAWPGSNEEDVYLVSQRGAMLSDSKYRDKLNELPLLRDRSSNKAPLILDPGVDLVAGERPTTQSSTWSRTLMANRVTAGNSEVNTVGYRNYVGRRVVGAWRWLEEHEIGIAVELEYNDAFRIAQVVRYGLYGLALGMFALSIVGITMAGWLASKSDRKIRDLSEVGPYQVQELLGEGGMGRVYLAEHALLCRQSAVKVLTHHADDLSVISRFEREVQLASQLTHPNTISIYDFGRNRDGLFYYAMEYINGSHLGQLVEYEGPIHPGRCIYILRQLCNALQEAHQAGVVHRDIKPQNIMVCNRGGEPDFVKLVDYGLVKSFAPGVSEDSAQTRVVVGTPRFMAPERLNSPWLADPRVDVYSVGALAYFLLTGLMPPLVTMDHGLHAQTGVETLDLPPNVIPFGEILSLCLAVEPAGRPSSMLSLVRELDELSRKFPWTRDDSIQWWSKNEAKLLLLVRNKRKELTSSNTIVDLTKPEK
ncbi:MAG: serine/threonine-protein kinase [Planctomycetota bacterium]